MKVTNEKTENRQTYLTVEMDQVEVDQSLDKAFRRLVQKRRVPGFRLGKTPRNIFEKYFTHQALLEEALDDLIPEAYKKAVQEQAIEPISNPQIEITQTEPVIFKAVVPLKPIVEPGDYGEIRVPPEVAQEIGDKEIDEVIDRLRHQHSTWEPAERAVLSGDRLTIDVASEVDGKPYINQAAGEYQAATGATFPVPGFAEQLIGMKKDDEKEFELEFPADDSRKDYAGKKGKFKVKVSDIKEEKLPEPNDDFAKLIGDDFKTFSDLRERATKNLKDQAAENARLAYEDKVLGATVDKAKIEYPEVLVDSEIHNLIDQRFQTRQEFDNYMKILGKTEEQLHDELHQELEPVANNRIKRALVLGKVADEEKIEATDADIDAEVEKMLAAAGDNRESFAVTLGNPEVRESIRKRLVTRKTMDRLLDIAKGEHGTEDKKEGSK